MWLTFVDYENRLLSFMLTESSVVKKKKKNDSYNNQHIHKLKEN